MNCFNHLKTNNVLYKVITFFSQNIELKSRSGLFRNLFLMAIFIFIVISKSAVSSNMLFSMPTEVSFSETEAKEHTEQQAFMQWLASNPLMDTTSLGSLSFFLQSHSSSVSSAARGLLIANGLLEYNEPYLTPDLTKSSVVRNPVKNSIIPTKSLLKVYPNPAHDFITIEYNTNNDKANVVVELSDESGRKVYSQQLVRQLDAIIIDTRHYKSGNYFVSLIVDNKIANSAKFVIAR